jgi:hypothetical protein
MSMGFSSVLKKEIQKHMISMAWWQQDR